MAHLDKVWLILPAEGAEGEEHEHAERDGGREHGERQPPGCEETRRRGRERDDSQVGAIAHEARAEGAVAVTLRVDVARGVRRQCETDRQRAARDLALLGHDEHVVRVRREVLARAREERRVERGVGDDPADRLAARDDSEDPLHSEWRERPRPRAARRHEQRVRVCGGDRPELGGVAAGERLLDAGHVRERGRLPRGHGDVALQRRTRDLHVGHELRVGGGGAIAVERPPDEPEEH